MTQRSSIGSSAVDVVLDLLARNPEIKDIEVFAPAHVPLIQNRMNVSASVATILDSAGVLREKYKLPFWDGVLLSCFDKGEEAAPLLEQARFHNTNFQGRWKLSAKECTPSKLREIGDSIYPSAHLVMSSRVTTYEGQVRHIPMVDFHLPANRENLLLATKIVNLCGLSSGYLLESGKSYHFYGAQLIQASELPDFLGKLLLFSPAIDRAWIAHQLIAGACGLRVSMRAHDSALPRLVAKL